MRVSRLLLCLCAMVLVAAGTSAQSFVTVYSHDFETYAGREWSRDTRSLTPNLHTTFLGRFGGVPVTLDLVDLPQHCLVRVSFELFIIGSWEGSVGQYAGPDIWDLNAYSRTNCCPVQNLIHATFANCECKYQTYPEDYPYVHNPGWTGADEGRCIDATNYDLQNPSDNCSAVFRNF